MKTAKFATITCTTEIEAAPHKVWIALTDEIGHWWPAEFYAGDAKEREFHLDAEPGGRMYEASESGGGVLWATVVAVDPDRQLQVVGQLFPNWGGPSQWFGTWTLEVSDGSTRLTFEESSIGNVTDAGMAEKERGWRFVCQCLKAHVEGKPGPIWSD